jgi:cobalamin biosynthesis protein CobT
VTQPHLLDFDECPWIDDEESQGALCTLDRRRHVAFHDEIGTALDGLPGDLLNQDFKRLPLASAQAS